jgi:hypothetical protein
MFAAVHMYDIVYVGGGIACLYSAHMHLKRNPGTKIIVLEKTGRVGGRADWAKFEGVDVVKGAGVGRFRKDKALLALLDDLGVGYKAYDTDLGDEHRIAPALNKLRAKLDTNNKSASFKRHGIDTLGLSEYRRLVQAVGYADYERMDAGIALDHYGFEDTYGKQTNFAFSWEDLVRKLSTGLEIITRCEAASVNTGSVTTRQAGVFHGRHVCVGVTANALRKLFPGVAAYRRIASQPFMRVYAKLSAPLPLDGYTVVGGVLQKMIPIRDRVVMVAYADNANALKLRHYTKSDMQRELDKVAVRRFGAAAGDFIIEKLVMFFWEEGTHYYKPSKNIRRDIAAFVHRAQRPMPGVYVIGEAVGINQGWTNSALLSAHHVAAELASTNGFHDRSIIAAANNINTTEV